MAFIKSFKEFCNFLNESESYNDYPEEARKAAKKAIEWKEKYGEEVQAGTPVGWKRAHQLVNGEKLTIDTIRRMKAFFDRHEGNKEIAPEYKETPWKDRGYVAWLLWGGDAARKWAEEKLKEIENKNKS